jgi:alpha-ketoglutarate-dependent taurine dioxygenase
MKTTALMPDMGVDVEGVNLAELGDEDADALRRLCERHHLVRVRGQTLEPGDQVRCVSRFGPVADERQDGTFYGRMTNRHVSGSGLKALPWHSDFASTPYPYPIISLYAEEAAGAISGTRFVSAIRAYNALPEELKRRIADLEVLNVAKPSGEFSHIDFSAEWERIRTGSFDGVVTRLPAVREHPKTGEKLLYVSAMFSAGFDGLAYSEGSELLTELFATLYDDAHTFTHSWSPGDFLLWDNVALQHSREAVAPPAPDAKQAVRTFTRVVVSDGLDDLFAYLPGLRETLSGNFAQPKATEARQAAERV